MSSTQNWIGALNHDLFIFLRFILQTYLTYKSCQAEFEKSLIFSSNEEDTKSVDLFSKNEQTEFQNKWNYLLII